MINRSTNEWWLARANDLYILIACRGRSTPIPLNNVFIVSSCNSNYAKIFTTSVLRKEVLRRNIFTCHLTFNMSCSCWKIGERLVRYSLRLKLYSEGIPTDSRHSSCWKLNCHLYFYYGLYPAHSNKMTSQTKYDKSKTGQVHSNNSVKIDLIFNLQPSFNWRM